MSTPPKQQPYLHKGQVLSSPPLSARIRSFFDTAYIFLALYIITLFSLEPYAAAEASSFNIRNRDSSKRSGWGSGRRPGRIAGSGDPMWSKDPHPY